MKVRVTFDVDDTARRAIAHLTGRRIASHREVANWIDATVQSTLLSIVSELEEREEDRRERAGDA